MALELRELKELNEPIAGTRGPFAVAENLRDGHRVLYFLQDEAEAAELAAELRRRGVRAGAFRTAC